MWEKGGARWGLIGAILLTAPQTARSDELSDLKAQVEQLRNANTTLQEQLNRQRETTERVLGKIESLERHETLLAQEMKGLTDTSEALPVEGAAERSLLNVPKLTMRGFADFVYTVSRFEHETDNTFSTGWKGEEVDLLITSALTDRVSFLLEPNFSMNTENSPTFKIQRTVLKYDVSDLLKIKVGREHMALGYWNQVYHHGAWLQTTIFRPEIYRLEAQDGFLPVHAVGLNLLGSIPVGDAFDLDYDVGVYNGRGRAFNEVPERVDKNRAKAVNVLLSVKPYVLEGLRMGFDIYHDTIPSNPPTARRTKSIDELILGGHAVYLHDNLELLAELFQIRHNDKSTGLQFQTLGWYAQGSYKINAWTPYYRFDLIDVADADPFWTSRHRDLNKHTLGARWDLLPWNAWKLEYSFNDEKGRTEGDEEHTLTVNSSIVF